MTIRDYILEHDNFNNFDTLMVYEVILTLIRDGKLTWDEDAD